MDPGPPLPDDNRQFAGELELDDPTLSDPGKQVATAYGAVGGVRPYAQRWTFFVGNDGKIGYIDKTVGVAAVGKDVAEWLAALSVATRK